LPSPTGQPQSYTPSSNGSKYRRHALVGSDGVATSDITDGHGQVKVDGEEWSARALEPGSTIAAGEKIEVYEIDGATLVVYPVFRSLSS
ncbi:NfeD family protein, partial [Cutibacterium acnes]